MRVGSGNGDENFLLISFPVCFTKLFSRGGWGGRSGSEFFVQVIEK